jgi:hypothetical protein
MTKTRWLFWPMFVLALTFLMVFQAWSQPKTEKKAPVITNAFAVDKGRYGTIWKIYIEAEDPDGDMLRIASVVEQPGYGHYPTNWTYLKPQYKGHFKGYLQWNTFSSKAGTLPEWTQITLYVSVMDRANNESNIVAFPFTFEIGAKSEPIPAPFNEKDLPRLGYLSIDLVNPYTDHGARDD